MRARRVGGVHVRVQRLQAFFQHLEHAHARVQRRERVLEDDLHRRAAPPAARRPQLEQVAAVSSAWPSMTAWPRSSCTMALPVVVLPQPDSPTSASVLARRHLEATRRRPP